MIQQLFGIHLNFASPAFLFAETQLMRLLLLRDYNTRVVIAGTMLLGVVSGVLGVYLLLRKRALLGDAISHATLPGVALAFLLTSLAGQNKSLAVLLVGAAISGALGGVCVLLLRHWAKIREDAALGIVLSVFFGAGVALVSVVQQLPGGNIAGLESFIYGKVVAMTGSDVALAAWANVIVLGTLAAFSKELKILCFDTELARSQGWPVMLLDCMLIAMLVMVTIVGLQAIGLIMVIALLVIPAASARFWTHSLRPMVCISGLIGGMSCAIGAMASALFADLPSGATIVLFACAAFLLSFAFGTQRGQLWAWLRSRRMQRTKEFKHMLRICYERLEAANAKLGEGASPITNVPIADVAEQRNWGRRFAMRVAMKLESEGMIVVRNSNELQLTPRGMALAEDAVREHRLLELYLMEQTMAEVGQADRDADYLEHGILPEHLAELGERLASNSPSPVPPSPHKLDAKE
jgi:manganese/zinc/iron transport system permease protein